MAFVSRLQLQTPLFFLAQLYAIAFNNMDLAYLLAKTACIMAPRNGCAGRELPRPHRFLVTIAIE
jgi:hypothetical protein